MRNHLGRCRALFGMLLFAGWCGLGAGCGGRSIGAGEGNTDGSAAAGVDEDDESIDCKTVCEESRQCAVAGVGDCDFFCGAAESEAAQAGCARPYGGLVGCLQRLDDVCDLSRSCVREINAFGVCLLDYCADNPGARLCRS